MQSLAAPFGGIRDQLAQPDLGYYDVQGLRTRLEHAEQAAQQRIKELRAIYLVDPRPEVRLRLSDLAGGRRITSAEDLERMLDELRQRVLAQLASEQTVVLE